MRETYFWELWTTMYRVFLFSCVIFTLVKDEFCQDKTSVRGLGFALHIMYVDFNNKSSYNIMTIFCFCFFLFWLNLYPPCICTNFGTFITKWTIHTLPIIVIFYSIILARRDKMYWNLMWKSPGFVPFRDNLTQYRSILTSMQSKNVVLV